MKELIRLKNVTVQSEDYEILRDISLSFAQSRSTVILGPAGCGKSTLLKVAAGIIMPDRGSVFIDGENLLTMPERDLKAFRRRNGFAFQDAALWANQSLYENLFIPLRFHNPRLKKSEIHDRVMQSLESTGMDSQAHLRPAQISSGEQKIVSFCRALILEPEVLYMDEPTLSIDARVLGIIYDLIRRYKQKGCTLLVVTHDQDLTSWLADDLIVLKAGEVVEMGPFDEVKNSENQEVQSILSSVLSRAASYDTDILGLLAKEQMQD